MFDVFQAISDLAICNLSRLFAFVMGRGNVLLAQSNSDISRIEDSQDTRCPPVSTIAGFERLEACV